MTRRICGIICLVFIICGFPEIAHPANVTAEPWLKKVVFGLVLHDRGPFSDRHEAGVDPNVEVQLTPPNWRAWRWLGSPRPMLGLTPNFNGDTSVFYGGLDYELSLSNHLTDELTGNFTTKFFVGASLSLALHNGPLHKNRRGCEARSDCGFGYRALPRLGFEVGSYFADRHGVSIFYDHMSHQNILPGENEGIDHIGVRYHFRFGSP